MLIEFTKLLSGSTNNLIPLNLSLSLLHFAVSLTEEHLINLLLLYSFKTTNIKQQLGGMIHQE